MSVQNALKLIRKYRERKDEDLIASVTLRNLVDLSGQEDLPCSLEDLKKAFQIDWDIRWLKHTG